MGAVPAGQEFHSSTHSSLAPPVGVPVTSSFTLTPQGARQAPPTQESPAEQAWLQAPQLAGSLWRFDSQPSTCLLPLQSAKPEAQTPLQMPPPQLGVMLFAEQVRPHVPQFWGSTERFDSQPSTGL